MKDLLTLTKIKNGDVKAFEQVFRVAFLLSAACLVVYAFGWDKKYFCVDRIRHL